MTVTPDPEDERLVTDDDVEAVEDELLARPDDADEADVIEQHQVVPDGGEDEVRDAAG